jgi:DNA-binding HxlR family transcriptional regulator
MNLQIASDLVVAAFLMNAKAKKTSEPKRSACPVAGTLDIVGDKWSLLIVRDMAAGKRTYGEFAASPEGIPTNILADRLRRLGEAGIVVREAYQEHPPRYAYVLTDKGRDLGDVVRAFARWGEKHVPGVLTRAEVAALRRRS